MIDVMEITADMPGENENKVNDERAPRALSPFAATGRTVIAWVGSMGAAAIFLFLAVARIPGRNQFSRIVQQTYYIGASAITIIMHGAVMMLFLPALCRNLNHAFGFQNPIPNCGRVVLEPQDDGFICADWNGLPPVSAL